MHGVGCPRLPYHPALFAASDLLTTCCVCFRMVITWMWWSPGFGCCGPLPPPTLPSLAPAPQHRPSTLWAGTLRRSRCARQHRFGAHEKLAAVISSWKLGTGNEGQHSKVFLPTCASRAALRRHLAVVTRGHQCIRFLFRIFVRAPTQEGAIATTRGSRGLLGSPSPRCQAAWVLKGGQRATLK